MNKLDELEQIFSENNIEVMSFKELGTVNDYALKTMPKLIKALRKCIKQRDSYIKSIPSDIYEIDLRNKKLEDILNGKD